MQIRFYAMTDVKIKKDNLKERTMVKHIVQNLSQNYKLHISRGSKYKVTVAFVGIFFFFWPF